MAHENEAEMVAKTHNEAVERLMAVMPHETPEERRIYAHWIVEAIVRAAVVDTTARMLDANRGVSR